LGYSVIEAKSGEEALAMLRRESADLVLLDLNMPGIGGLETCRAIRESSDVPIIVLSVRNTERDKVDALDAGADDYVTKPYGIQELLARIRATMRRMPASGESGPENFVSDDLEIDFNTRRATVAGKSARLTPKE
jgi:two-component system KDP operon response regulator KdpE